MSVTTIDSSEGVPAHLVMCDCSYHNHDHLTDCPNQVRVTGGSPEQAREFAVNQHGWWRGEWDPCKLLCPTCIPPNAPPPYIRPRATLE